MLGLDETFFGHFLGLKNQPVLIAPSGPLGPGWGLKTATFTREFSISHIHLSKVDNTTSVARVYRHKYGGFGNGFWGFYVFQANAVLLIVVVGIPDE